MQLQWPFFYQPKWFHYRGFSYSLTQGCREGLARGWEAGGTVRIIKVTVGIIIPAMERASKPLFSSPAQMHYPWLLVTKNFVINGASTYYLYEWGKRSRREGDLYQHDNFPSLRLMTGTDRGDQGEHKKGSTFRCRLSADLLPVFVGDLTLHKKKEKAALQRGRCSQGPGCSWTWRSLGHHSKLFNWDICMFPIYQAINSTPCMHLLPFNHALF